MTKLSPPTFICCCPVSRAMDTVATWDEQNSHVGRTKLAYILD